MTTSRAPAKSSRSIRRLSRSRRVPGGALRPANLHRHGPQDAAPVHRRTKPKKLVMMDADTGKIIGDAFPIGDRADAKILIRHRIRGGRDARGHAPHFPRRLARQVEPGRNGEDRIRGQDHGPRPQDPQPLPHHVGFRSGSRANGETAQSATRGHAGNVSPADLRQVTRRPGNGRRIGEMRNLKLRPKAAGRAAAAGTFLEVALDFVEAARFRAGVCSSQNTAGKFRAGLRSDLNS